MNIVMTEESLATLIEFIGKIIESKDVDSIEQLPFPETVKKAIRNVYNAHVINEILPPIPQEIILDLMEEVNEFGGMEAAILKEKHVLVPYEKTHEFVEYMRSKNILIHGGAFGPRGQWFYIE